jgi:hypothetical protein
MQTAYNQEEMVRAEDVLADSPHSRTDVSSTIHFALLIILMEGVPALSLDSSQQTSRSSLTIRLLSFMSIVYRLVPLLLVPLLQDRSPYMEGNSLLKDGLEFYPQSD